MKNKKKLITFALMVIFKLIMLSACKSAPETTADQPLPEQPLAALPLMPAAIADPQVPLTVSILQRLGDSVDSLESSIGRFQFVLSGKITLERNYSIRNDTISEGEIPNFEDEHITEVIAFNDQTMGMAIGMRNERSRLILSICFESDDDLQLFFSCPENETDEYFYLDYTPVNSDEPLLNNEAGTLVYGRNNFNLSTGDTRPYLLINLTQRDIDTLNSRTAPGRRHN